MIELKLLGAALCWVAAFWVKRSLRQSQPFDLSNHLEYKPSKRMLEFHSHSTTPSEAMREAALVARACAQVHLSRTSVKLDCACVQKAIIDGMFIRLDNAGYETDAYVKKGACVYVVTFIGEPGEQFYAHTYIVTVDLQVYRAYENESGHPEFAFIGDSAEVNLEEDA